MSSNKIHDDLKALASGINHVLMTRFAGSSPEFLLILVSPEHEAGTVTLNTITAITDPAKIRQIGHHLIDMATAQMKDLDPDDDREIRGHA